MSESDRRDGVSRRKGLECPAPRAAHPDWPRWRLPAKKRANQLPAPVAAGRVRNVRALHTFID